MPLICKRLKAYKDIPVILFTYYNPVFVLGIDFAGDAHNAGIDGVLIVDLPPEECGELARHIRKKRNISDFSACAHNGRA